MAFGRWASATLLACVWLSTTGCPDETTTPDAMVPEDAGAVVDARVTMDAAPRDTGPADSGIFRDHDAGQFVICANTCACPQGMGCVDGLCRNFGTPVWCCDKPGCPGGAMCVDERDRPGECPIVEEPDGGVGADAGPGQVGDFCERDSDCDPAEQLTCWSRNEPPFVWGYCTRENCVGGCPMGSECLSFNDQNMTTGCLKTCQTEMECRSDAYCLPINGAPFGGVCLPDCRDDFFDCSPRDGSRYCDLNTGRCQVTLAQSSSAQIGDPCRTAVECGRGQTCMTERVWNLSGGLCTQVCSGLPEASPCPSGHSCHTFAGVGLCFVDCIQGVCPDRPGASCRQLDPSWTSPACLPP